MTFKKEHTPWNKGVKQINRKVDKKGRFIKGNGELNRLCEVDDCNNKHSCNGVCHKHNEQIIRNGRVLERTKDTPNEIVDFKNHCEIILYNDKYQEVDRAIIDKEDKQKVIGYKWYKNNSGYVICYLGKKYGSKCGKRVLLHHIIIGKKRGLVVDHINYNKVDNRKINLRHITQNENIVHGGGKLQGVLWHKKCGKWYATIGINYKRIWLGLFDNKKDAIKARRQAEIKYYENIN